MTVNVTFSTISGRSEMSDTTSIGNVSPGNITTFQDIYISHDASVSSITDCALYAIRYSGSSHPDPINGDPDAEYIEIMGWGDAATGGFKLVMDGWGSWTGGRNITGTRLTLKNGYGDVDNQIPLDKDSIVVGTPPSSDGEIPVDGEAHIQIEFEVPSSVSSGAGYKAISLVFAYSATS